MIDVSYLISTVLSSRADLSAEMATTMKMEAVLAMNLRGLRTKGKSAVNHSGSHQKTGKKESLTMWMPITRLSTTERNISSWLKLDVESWIGLYIVYRVSHLLDDLCGVD